VRCCALSDNRPVVRTAGAGWCRRERPNSASAHGFQTGGNFRPDNLDGVDPGGGPLIHHVCPAELGDCGSIVAFVRTACRTVCKGKWSLLPERGGAVTGGSNIELRLSSVITCRGRSAWHKVRTGTGRHPPQKRSNRTLGLIRQRGRPVGQAETRREPQGVTAFEYRSIAPTSPLGQGDHHRPHGRGSMQRPAAQRSMLVCFDRREGSLRGSGAQGSGAALPQTSPEPFGIIRCTILGAPTPDRIEPGRIGSAKGQRRRPKGRAVLSWRGSARNRTGRRADAP